MVAAAAGMKYGRDSSRVCDVAGRNKDHRHTQDEGRVPASQSAPRGARHGHPPTSQHRAPLRNSQGAALTQITYRFCTATISGLRFRAALYATLYYLPTNNVAVSAMQLQFSPDSVLFVRNRMYTCPKKHSDIFSCNLNNHCPILMFLHMHLVMGSQKLVHIPTSTE